MKHVTQAGLRGALVTGRYAPYSKAATAECVVIAVRYIDDKNNVSKQHVEYDVRDLRTGQVYESVRRIDVAQGMEDGDENILRPAQKLLGAASPVFDPKTAQLSQSDGDRVKVAFGYGAQHSAAIVGVLPHPKLNYGTTRAQGVRRFQTHKGTSVEIKKDGTYQIKRNDTTITIAADETIEVLHTSGSKMRFTTDGDIDVQPARDLKLGSYRSAEVEAAVRGETYRTAEDKMLASVESAMSALAVVFGTTGAFPNPAAAAAAADAKAAIDAFQDAASTYLATVAKVK